MLFIVLLSSNCFVCYLKNLLFIARNRKIILKKEFPEIFIKATTYHDKISGAISGWDNNSTFPVKIHKIMNQIVSLDHSVGREYKSHFPVGMSLN